MDTLITMFLVGLAVFYLYRRLTTGMKEGAPSCGCGGCGAQCRGGASASEKDNGLAVLKKSRE